MRAILVNTLSICLLTALLAVGTLESMAATPDSLPPGIAFSTQKVAKGLQRAPGGKVLAADGTNFYTAYTFIPRGGGEEFLMLSRGTNSGKTWESPYTVIKVPPDLLTPYVAVAAGGDAADTTRKIIQLVWHQYDDNSHTKGSVYYSWADNTKLNKWSIPVKINGSAMPANSNSLVSIVAGRTGAIHVLFWGNDEKLYATTAQSRTSTFTPPAPLPGNPRYDTDPDMVLDGNGNLHAAFMFSDDPGKIGLRYTKKAAGSTTWMDPVVVLPLTNAGSSGFCSIAAQDENNIYIALQFDGVGLFVFSSANGGASWSQKAVAKPTATSNPSMHVSIAASPTKILTVGTNFDDPTSPGATAAKIFKSTDGGITWGTPATLSGHRSVSIALDGSGKAGIMTNLRKSTAAEQEDPNAELYFSKEK
ncbi:MAG: exo-alpha-sialidase [Steroidobacteraceae bacterium]|nr:exo-alpha-sialidase [Deltaproteobacteria bacterium]